MIRTTPSVLFAFFAFVFGFQPAPAQDGPQPAYVPGRILVKFRPEASADKVFDVLARAQARTERVLEDIDVHILSLPPEANEMAYVNAFKGLAEVEFAELDRVVAPSAINPNDPYYSVNWHFFKISAPSAWSVTTGSSNLVIAFVDTGIDGTHQDLASKLVGGWNVVDSNTTTSDVNNHGTEAAGTAAEIANNTLGSAGICWGCRIMPVRVTNDSYGRATSSNVAAGITWAANHGAKIAAVGYALTDDATVTSAAQYLWSKGGIAIMPSGNLGTVGTAPNNTYVLTVGGTDNSDVPYSWSNTGNNLDLVAPGCVNYTPAPINSYATQCGTSASMAIVAGVASLVWSVNPTLTPADVTRILQQSADDKGAAGWDPTYGWGRVNALNAVNAAGAPPPADTTRPTVSITYPTGGATVSGAITIAASASDNVGVSSVTFAVDGATKCTDSTAAYTCLWDTTTAANGSHTITATARDAANNSASASITVTVSNTTSDTTRPTVNITYPAAGATVSGTITIQASASDNVGVTQVTFAVDGATKCTDTAASYACPWDTKTASNGSHTITATARDAANNAASASIAVTVSNSTSDTTPPTVTLVAPGNGATVSGMYTMSANASDNVAVARVEFRVDGVLKCSDTTYPYSCSWDTKTSSNGGHTATATAYDNAGNTTADPNAVTVSNTTSDTTAPSVRFVSPVNGAMVSGRVTVSVSATDNVGVVKTELYIDGSLQQSSSSGSLTYLWNSRNSLGPHTLTAKSYDAAGKIGTASISVTAVK